MILAIIPLAMKRVILNIRPYSPVTPKFGNGETPGSWGIPGMGAMLGMGVTPGM